MKIALVLIKYFPYGGLQRDFKRIALELLRRGHEVVVYTSSWEGEPLINVPIHYIKLAAWQNHNKNLEFASKLTVELKKVNYDAVLGFNKLPGLDFYYAADICYKAKNSNRSLFYRLTPRYQALSKLENSVFAKTAKTKILMIAPFEKNNFVKHYATENARFFILPPGIEKERLLIDVDKARTEIKNAFNLHNKFVLLFVGSGFKTKGLDRVINSISALPPAIKANTQLIVIGNDKIAKFINQAKQQNVKENVTFLGGRDDVAKFLVSADLLIHPAYHENTGTVLLEALVCGLPVLTTDSCGYAGYIEQAKAGVVIKSPFKQEFLNKTLVNSIESKNSSLWRKNALAFAQNNDLYTMPSKVAAIVEQEGRM